MRILFFFSFIFIFFSLYTEEYRISPESLIEEKEKLDIFFRKISSGNKAKWKETEWALKRSNLISFSSENTEKALRIILSERTLNPSVKKAAADYIYSRYAELFQEETGRLFSEEKDRRMKFLFSLCLEKGKPSYANLTEKLLREEFEENHPYREGYFLWKNSEAPEKSADLNEMFSFPFIQGSWIFFSLHRKDSRYPGILVIRRPDGKFLKEESGTYFHISHLASSASGLPFFITNGQTPKGIYFFKDTVISGNPDIGPVPALRLYLPGEISAADFFGDSRMKKKWHYKMIRNILPPSMKKNNDFKETYIAGTAGRSGIWSHGTAVNPEFFRYTDAYPLIPAAGCFTAPEIWSSETGKLLHSSHLSLLKTMKKNKIQKGYLIAVTLDEKERPVALEDILTALSQTEE